MSDSEMNTDEETYSDSGTIHATLPESEGQPGSATELVLRATTVGRVVHFKRRVFEWHTPDLYIRKSSEEVEWKRFGEIESPLLDDRWKIRLSIPAMTGNENELSDEEFVELELVAVPTPDELQKRGHYTWKRDRPYSYRLEYFSLLSDAIMAGNGDCLPVMSAPINWSSTNDSAWRCTGIANGLRLHALNELPKSTNGLIVMLHLQEEPQEPEHDPSVTLEYDETLRDEILYMATTSEPKSNDVVFVFPARRPNLQPETISARKAFLTRTCTYFETMFSGDFSEGGPSIIATEAEEILQRETFEADSDLEGDDEDSDYEMSSVTTSSDGDEQSLGSDSGAEEMGTNAPTPNPPSAPAASTTSAALTPTVQSDASVPLSPLPDSALTTSIAQNLGSTDAPPSNLATTPEIAHAPQAETGNQEAQTESSTGANATNVIPDDPPTRIIVRDFSKRTYQALLWYLHSGVISFAPLHRQFLHDKHWDFDDYRRNYCHTLNSCDRPPLEHGLLPSSPKSIFRLADKLGLIDLRVAARNQIIQCLNNDIALEEATSTFSTLFPEVRRAQLQYITNNWLAISADKERFGALWAKRPNSPLWFELLYSLGEGALSS